MMNEKEQLWYTRFLNYANSGMSRTHWCRENGIAISSFRYWCKKFDAMRIDDMQEDTESAASSWYELSCSSGSEMTTQAPRKTGDPIRLQISDLKLEFPAVTARKTGSKIRCIPEVLQSLFLRTHLHPQVLSQIS